MKTKDNNNWNNGSNKQNPHRHFREGRMTKNVFLWENMTYLLCVVDVISEGTGVVDTRWLTPRGLLPTSVPVTDSWTGPIAPSPLLLLSGRAVLSCHYQHSLCPVFSPHCVCLPVWLHVYRMMELAHLSNSLSKNNVRMSKCIELMLCIYSTLDNHQ